MSRRPFQVQEDSIGRGNNPGICGSRAGPAGNMEERIGLMASFASAHNDDAQVKRAAGRGVTVLRDAQRSAFGRHRAVG